MSFHKVGLKELATGKMPFVGLQNFFEVSGDKLWIESFLHTLAFTAVVVGVQILLGLGIALLIYTPLNKFSRAIKAVMLVPWAVSPVTNGILWKFLFDPSFGHLNVVLQLLGITNDFILWLSDPKLALWAIALAYIWRVTPFCVLLFYAALQGVPKELYEVADLDGATAWSKFKNVTLPLIMPVLAILLVLRTMFSLRVFAEIFSMTYGGPGTSTWVVGWYIYSTAFRYFRYGVGCAAGMLLYVTT